MAFLELLSGSTGARIVAPGLGSRLSDDLCALGRHKLSDPVVELLKLVCAEESPFLVQHFVAEARLHQDEVFGYVL